MSKEPREFLSFLFWVLRRKMFGYPEAAIVSQLLEQYYAFVKLPGK